MNVAIENNADAQTYGPAIEAINEAVAKEFGITVEKLKEKTRKREIVVPRHVAIFFTNEVLYTYITLQEIATEYGLNNHTSVIHALENVRKKYQYQKENQWIIARLMQRFNITELRPARSCK